MPDGERFLTRYPVAGFLLVAFGISWSAGVLALNPAIVLAPELKTFFNYLAKFGPSLAGVVLWAAIRGRTGLRELVGRLLQWRVAANWYAVALLGPLALWALAAAMYFAFTDARPTIELAGLAVFPGLFALRVLLGGGLGEELGWRGFLLPVLTERHGALIASLWIGLIWGLWHAPAFMFPGAGKEGDVVTLLLFTVYCTGLSLIFSWVYRGTGGSLLLVVLLHGTANSTENAVKATLPALAGEAATTFLYGGLVLVVALATIPLLRRGRLGRA